MKKNIIICAFFFILSVIFTFPLIFGLNTYISGFNSTDEPFGVLWFFWWLKYACLHHLDFSHCFLAALPFGLKIPLASMYPLADFISKWLAIGFGEIAAYNLQVFISYVLAGYFVYFLVYKITLNHFAGIFSGIICAFCPYHAVRTWQHPSLAQIQWLVLFLFALHKFKTENSLKNRLFAALTLAVVTLFNYYYAYFALVIMLTFVIYAMIRDKSQGVLVLKGAGIVLLFYSLIIFPAVLPILKDGFMTHSRGELLSGGYVRPFDDLFSQSARPLSYFLPATVHPIFGKFSEQFIGSPLYGMSFTEHTLYLGWVPLILAFVAIRRWRKRNKGQSPWAGNVSRSGGDSPLREDFYIGFFLFLAIVAWLFSQPPWWKIGAFKIYMPPFFMYKILPMFRAYCRFGIVVMLAVAVLAGFGLKFILEIFKTQKAKIALTSLFCSLVLFEFWTWPPYKVIDVSKVPAVYYWLKEHPGDFTIAEYPLDIDGAGEMYKFFQTKHGKKIINGTIPGTYANKVSRTIAKLSASNTVEILKMMKVKYVLVHKEDYLKTELVDEIEELNKIPKNPSLKLVKSFPEQECPEKDMVCIQKTGQIDVYEVEAESAKLKSE